MGKLRDEIIESEKQYFDLIKWKLLIAAAIGVISFGFELTGKPHSSTCSSASIYDKPLYLLAFLPLANAYIDLHCQQLTIRILVIGRFLRSLSKSFQETFPTDPSPKPNIESMRSTKIT